MRMMGATQYDSGGRCYVGYPPPPPPLHTHTHTPTPPSGISRLCSNGGDGSDKGDGTDTGPYGTMSVACHNQPYPQDMLEAALACHTAGYTQERLEAALGRIWV